MEGVCETIFELDPLDERKLNSATRVTKNKGAALWSTAPLFFLATAFLSYALARLRSSKGFMIPQAKSTFYV
jgi:hypothetical protein